MRAWPVVAVAALVLAAAVLLLRRDAAQERARGARSIATRIVLDGVDRQRDGQLDVAEALYEEALRVDPDVPHAAYDLGTIAMDRHLPRLAEFWLERALVVDPADKAAKGNLDVVRKRLAEEPQVHDVELMTAGLAALDDRHDPERAVLLFRQLLDKRPTHYGGVYQLARALDAAGRSREARAYWERSLQMARDIHDAPTIASVEARLAKPD